FDYDQVNAVPHHGSEPVSPVPGEMVTAWIQVLVHQLVHFFRQHVENHNLHFPTLADEHIDAQRGPGVWVEIIVRQVHGNVGRGRGGNGACRGRREGDGGRIGDGRRIGPGEG